MLATEIQFTSFEVCSMRKTTIAEPAINLAEIIMKITKFQSEKIQTKHG